MYQPQILVTEPSRDYELIDSGEGEKLERFGSYVISRPDPQALWKKGLPKTEWGKACASFNNKWQVRVKIPDNWQVELGGLNFEVGLNPFKHVGVFPEQASNWGWIKKQVSGKSGARILNLFGYTGGATLASAKSGASVTHVDASKAAITWAKGNAKRSGLENRPIRWILDDAKTFMKREVRRSNHYEGIILDPPAFGRGAKGEVWKIERDLIPLLDLCFEVLSEKPALFLLSGYASGYSAISYKQNILYLKEKFGGEIESGELAIKESKSPRLLPAGIFARWSAP